ncbi:uncharacterized protein METZ01_LOCUS145541 [marine metagenome]|uniref:Solute-binding protein family 5 domain-containing protein n=1 Tax=marine metagenome TaxID=408172 RepID=A0A381ZV10_9ZZZZ
MRLRVGTLVSFGVIAVMVMALVGCSSSDSGAAPAAPAAAAPAQAGSSSGYVPAAPAQPAAAAAAAAAPSAEVETAKKVSAKPKQTVAKTVTEFEGGKRGGVMKINTQKWFQRWDMTTRSHWSSTQGLNRHYSGVLQFSPRDGLTVTPDLAKEWTLTDDLMGSTFVFNEGVKWHDGEDFSVDDVIYTINRWQNPPEGVAQPRVAGLLLVDSMEKVGDNTLKITHTKPTSRILPAMADAWHIIHPEHVLSKTGGVLSSGEQVIGTGPFKVDSFSEGNNIVSVANPDYFQDAPDGSPFPYLDGITGIAFANNDLSAAALATGQIDYYTSLTPSKSFPIKNKRPSIIITRWDSPGFQGISMNTTKAPFDDLELRKAFACGLNTHAIAELSSTPGVVPMEFRQISFFGTADPNFENVAGLKCVDPAQREANEAESMAIFKAKGLTEVEFDSDNPDDPIATIVQQQMKELGVDVKIVTSEVTSAREKAYAGDTTLFFFGQAVASKSPVEIINQVYRPGAGFELYQATPPAKWSELLDQLDMATLGSEEEKALTAQMDTIMWEEWMPKVPVRRPDEFQVKQDYVRNIDAIATAKFIQSRFVDAWLDR